jgi:hypothetical protein
MVKNDYTTELNKNGVIGFVPGGNSMWPILKNHGQSVVVKEKTERLKKYDVAFYQRENKSFVLHRDLGVSDDGYVMCGDSQFTLEKVKEDSVFGVMVGYYQGKNFISSNDEKYLKKVIRWYKNETWRKISIKSFMFSIRVKNKLKSI